MLRPFADIDIGRRTRMTAVTTNHSLRKLFEYDTTANRRLLEDLRGQPEAAAEAARPLLAHLLATRQVWLERIADGASSTPLWPDWSWDECAERIEHDRGESLRLLLDRSPEELAERATYRNSTGVEFRTEIRDILFHVLIHGGYHRGQIARTVRRAGGEPINTDYITHVRSLDG
jgi:uncharacterized damage-inducible protein DinB